ncbi:hypothetical protein CROQUDRAFT_661650 [Cronartium quercuum f. sp. fusiforme G11]|uniref:Uncharacterized protein n=1 Tax=Cronartium quercuum f. sp. fusiforme G11 TaxID=708437 RepID=A0A9P6NCQ0_9BASI|nr:hypothetical protein CROQUDRAFT_661650 [Cronartium quercuum f. sp. fusiforme G11]
MFSHSSSLHSNYFYTCVYVLLIFVFMYLFPPSYTTCSYYLYRTLNYSPPFSNSRSDPDHSHPPITTASLHHTTTNFAYDHPFASSIHYLF